MPIRRDKVCKL